MFLIDTGLQVTHILFALNQHSIPDFTFADFSAKLHVIGLFEAEGERN
jgi:hypothetical protein